MFQGRGDNDGDAERWECYGVQGRGGDRVVVTVVVMLWCPGVVAVMLGQGPGNVEGREGSGWG